MPAVSSDDLWLEFTHEGLTQDEYDPEAHYQDWLNYNGITEEEANADDV